MSRVAQINKVADNKGAITNVSKSSTCKGISLLLVLESIKSRCEFGHAAHHKFKSTGCQLTNKGVKMLYM